MIPFIAVGIEPTVYYFKGNQAYLKFELPLIVFSEEEKNIWRELPSSDGKRLQVLCEQLFALRENKVAISGLSTELLSIESVEEQLKFAKSNSSQLLQHQNFITSMGKIRKNLEEEKSVTLLLLGTENRELFVLEQNGISIRDRYTLKAVPWFIEATGTYDVDYRIVIACRNGQIYTIRQKKI